MHAARGPAAPFVHRHYVRKQNHQDACNSGDTVSTVSSVGDRGPLGQDDLYVARHGPAMSKAPDTERVAELRLRDYIPTIQTIAAGCKKAVDVRGRGCALAIF